MRELVDRILANKVMFGMSLAGGGTVAISELLRHGGGSAVLDCAHVYYSKDALHAISGHLNTHVCSAVVARELAQLAWINVSCRFGVGCTAVLKSVGNEPVVREGHAYLAKHGEHMTEKHVTFPHSITREEQEELLAVEIFKLILGE